MAYFAAGQRKMNWKMAMAVSAALPALVAGGIVGTPRTAWADTTGNSGGLVSGAGILFVMGFGGGLVQPNSTATPPTVVDFTSSNYGYVRNDYMGVVQGYDGSYSVSYSNPSVSVSHQIGGMLSFGNQIGSLTYTTDNLGPLNGFNFSDPSSYTGVRGANAGLRRLASCRSLEFQHCHAVYRVWLRLLGLYPRPD